MVLTMLLVPSCKKSPPEVFPLKRLTSVEKGTTAQGDTYEIKTEYFVVANPPREQVALKAVLDTYNAKTLSQAEIDAYAATFRVFFRETKSTPRDYAESNEGYFAHDRIDDHARDTLVRVKWTKGSTDGEYTFYSEDELP